MATKTLKDGGVLRWKVNRGRNGFDVPSDLPDDMTSDSVNVRLVRGVLGQKRFGSVAQAITGDTFTGYNQLAKFVPGQNDAAAELFIISRDTPTKILRVAAGTAATNLAIANVIDTRPQDVHTAVLNGKLYLAYDSDENRLHVFDPNISVSTVRRSGLETPAAPTVANTGAGSYPATLRYYRVQWNTVVGSTPQRQSNLGASVSFTPSGSGNAARVTRPTPPGEGETLWTLWGSEDDAAYFAIQSALIATTFIDDSTLPSDYDENEAAPPEGAYTPWPSVKFLLSTGDRLVGFGVWETSAGDAMIPKSGRVYFSPILGTSGGTVTTEGLDDDERVSNSLEFKGWIDLGRNAGAEDRALAGPIEGEILAFQSRGVYSLTETGQANRPFARDVLSKTLGAVSQWSTFDGEDEFGRPCIYFLDPAKGPYRYGADGFQWCGYDVQDIWETFNPAATNRTAHGVWDPAARTASFWIATGSSNDPDVKLVFDAREGQASATEGVRYGWVRDTGTITTARCSVMFASSLGATMSRKLLPYLGFGSALWRIDDRSVSGDDGTGIEAYLDSPAFDLGPLQVNKRAMRDYLQAKLATGVTIQRTFTRNYGDEGGRSATVDLTPNGTETRGLLRFDPSEMEDAFSVIIRLGDAIAIVNNWTLDEYLAELETTTQR